MKLLEVRAALRMANKTDLFSGNVHDMNAKQWVKANTTVFYLDWKTNQLTGPHVLVEEQNFNDLYNRMAFGKCGVLTTVPATVTNEFLFELVLREGTIEDMRDTPKFMKLNRLYYIYENQALTGPFYTDNSTTAVFLENLIDSKKLFIPNERQHFKKKDYRKVGNLLIVE